MARTKTYIAGEWDGDNDAIDQLYKWNEGDKWSLHFRDAHASKQCYDSSMPCTIKSSLRERMNNSKIFVLVVGNNTASTRKGSCAFAAPMPSVRANIITKIFFIFTVDLVAGSRTPI